MHFNVFKRKRRKNGKLVVDRNYSGRYRIDGDFTATTVSLQTSDKQVALKKLRDIVQEKERERAGLIAPKLERVSAERPLLEHLEEFVLDLRTRGRTEKYIFEMSQRFTRLCKECNWRYLRDINADGFMKWRASYAASPKTLNEYLNACHALLNWMERHGRTQGNPLKAVQKISLKGKQQLRRAFTDEELVRLLKHSDDYGLLYLTAVYTGLRQAELNALLWMDVHLDEIRPYLQVRASTTKNSNEAIVPLHSFLVAEFRSAYEGQKGGDFVFPHYVYPGRRLNRHMKYAGIEQYDGAGRKLDFHSFRYTFATKLARQGVSQRLAQELMRHSDPRLTANLYTDAAHLPTFDAVDQLQWHDEIEIRSPVLS